MPKKIDTNAQMDEIIDMVEAAVKSADPTIAEDQIKFEYAAMIALMDATDPTLLTLFEIGIQKLLIRRKERAAEANA